MEKDSIKTYICGCFLQMAIVVLFVLFFRFNGWSIDYSTITGFTCIIVGGVSSAVWGAIVSVKYNNDSVHNIAREFFAIKKSAIFYPIILLLLIINFCSLFWGGIITVSKWYMPLLIFIKAIAFGGIEEIGWRYTLQPILDKKIGFIKATLCIFLLWGIWHYLFFYIDGSLQQIDMFGFYTGLLTNCFLLGMIYKKTESLWLCVFTHALINTLSQIFEGGSYAAGYVAKVMVIVICVIFILNREKISDEMK